MQIVIILPTFPAIGGTERTTAKLANRCVKNGDSVNIYSYQAKCGRERLNLDEQVNTFIVNHENDYSSILAIKADIILQQGFHRHIGNLCFKLRKHSNVKVISVLHTPPDFNLVLSRSHKYSFLYQYYVNFLNRHYFKYFHKNSDAIVLLSQTFIPLYTQMAKVKEKKFWVIPNALTYPITTQIFEKENTVLYLGRLDNEVKRIDRILNIWKEIHMLIPSWKLQIVGEGESEAALKQCCTELQLHNVEFHKGETKVSSYLQKASILMLTSEYEGFGLVITEAMQFGCIPIIYNTSSVFRDIISSSKNGFLIPAFHQKTFVDQLYLLTQNENLRKQMGAAAQIDCKKFDIETIWPLWEQLFTSLNPKR